MINPFNMYVHLFCQNLSIKQKVLKGIEETLLSMA